MMDHETRDHAIEASHSGQRFFEIVDDDGHISGCAKTLTQRVQHSRREIQRHELCLRSGRSDQPQQSSSAASQIENARGILRNEFQQRGFAFYAMRDGICPAKIFERMLGGGPEIYVG
jgi:hypothetical protein